MRRHLPLAVAVLLAAASASAQGQLAFDALDHDLGRLSESEPGRHTFSFSNAGDAPVRLVEAESNCGCTVPSYTSDPVAPGGTGGVSVVYETAGRPGPFERAVRVRTDAGQAVTLRISGSVEPALVANGQRVGSLAFETLNKDVGPLEPGAALQTSVRFANAGPRPVRIERVEAPLGVDVAFPDRPIFPDNVAGVFVTAEDPAALAAPDGGVEITLVLHTTDAQEPTKRLTLRAAP